MTTTGSAEQKLADRKLEIDEAYRTLDEYKISRQRVVFVAKGEKRTGGYGMVRKANLHASSYLPTWLSLFGKPQVVAVKEVVLSRMGELSDSKSAFTKAVLVWSRLKDHPGVAKFLGFCIDRREAWLISPWEPYGNVSEFICGRELEVPEKLSLAYDTIDALMFLHGLDLPVCHGDIKSANVLVSSECKAVLCDIGLAQLYEDSGFSRLESARFPWYSPELLDGKPRTSSSDIYAWGWLVWEIMTGELPCAEAKADYAIMRKIFEGTSPQVNGGSRLSECLQLWDLINTCWAAEPMQRPTSSTCRTTFDYLNYCPPTLKTADQRAHSAALLEKRGNFESWKGDHKAGAAYLEQALHAYEEEKDDKGIASVLLKQAAVASVESNFVKMKSAASAALEKCRSLQDDIGVAEALYWMGAPGSNTMDGIHNLEESLNIFRAKGKDPAVAKCLKVLGEKYRQQGQPIQALFILKEAIEVASRCGDKLVEADALDSLGLVYVGLRSASAVEPAISALQKAQDIARSIGWELGLSRSLLHLAAIKVARGLHAEAEEQLRESIRISRDSDAWEQLGQVLYGLGMCFQAGGRHEEAISALEQSCSVYRNLALPCNPDFASTAALLASSKSTFGQREEALAWYDTAIAEWRKCGDGWVDSLSECLAAKGAILAEMRRRDELFTWECSASCP